MDNVSDIFARSYICDLSSKTKDEVLVELCNLASRSPAVINSEGFLQAIRDRERVMSTGLGMGIAIPHAKTSYVNDFVVVVGRCREGVDFESLDASPVHIIILMGSPEDKSNEFLKLISRVGFLFSDSGFKQRFLDASSYEEMRDLLSKDST
jgi:mannitol/fructose-specific phosphotransferase system IIA component (Ntr-type)